MRITLLLLLTFCCATMNAQVTPDLTFATNGVGSYRQGHLAMTYRYFCTDSDIDTQGRILVTGIRDNNYASGSYVLYVLRLLDNGEVDSTFATEGFYVYSSMSLTAQNVFVKTLPNNKVILTTYNNLNPANLLVFQLNEDGTLDDSFGTNGISTIDVNGFDVPNNLVIQSDGKILIGGSQISKFVIRLNADGTLDDTFNSNGKILLPDYSMAYFALRNDGKILVPKLTNPSSNQFVLYIVTYNEDGTLNNTSAGFSFSSANSGVNLSRIAISPQGKIIVAATTGYTSTNPIYDIQLFSLNADGTPDLTFNSTGTLVCTDVETNDMINSLTIQQDGKILIGARAYSSITYDDYGFSMRVKTTGEMDDTFFTQGLFTDNQSTYEAKDVFTDDLGRLVVVSPSYYNSVVKRYDNNLIVTSVNSSPPDALQFVFPNPSFNQQFQVEAEGEIIEIIVSDVNGRNERYYQKEIHTDLKGILTVMVKTDKTVSVHKTCVW